MRRNKTPCKKRGKSGKESVPLCLSLASLRKWKIFSPSFSWSPLFALTDLLFYRFLWTYEEARKKRTIWPMLIFHFSAKKLLRSRRGDFLCSPRKKNPKFRHCLLFQIDASKKEKVHLPTQICKKILESKSHQLSLIVQEILEKYRQ